MLKRHLAKPAPFILSLATLAAIALLLLNAGSAVASSATIRVNPASQSATAPGVNITVNITQNASVTTSGAQSDLIFNPAIMQIQSVSLGSGYSGGSLVMGNTIAQANTSGTLIAVGAFFAPPTTVPTGDANVVSIVMQGVKCGMSALTLANEEVIDAGGSDIPVTGTNGSATAGIVTAWVTPVGDTDCDGFTDARENFMGTDPALRCAATTTLNDESPPDRWPTDFNDDRQTNLSDVFNFSPVFNSTGPNPPYNKRFDLNADNKINLSDILTIAPFFNKTCTP